MFIDFSEAAEFLRSCQDAVILTHRNPDGDCIGAGFAMKEILNVLGIRSRVVCHDPFPKRFDFLTETGVGEEFEPQSVIAVDIADVQLMGSLGEIYGDKVQLCIDHHISNKNYAEKTLLRGQATATCEIIYDLAEYMGVKLSRCCAMCIYTGIATDSGCFKYSCTTPRAHIIAADLMKEFPDINFARINRYMFDVKSKGRMLLESKVNELMEFYLGDRLAVIAVTRKMMNEMGVGMEELEGFAPMTIQLEDTEVGVLMREREDGEYKCSLRSADKINVSEICQTLGGGGHEKAAGCTIRGSLEEAKELIIGAVERALGK